MDIESLRSEYEVKQVQLAEKRSTYDQTVGIQENILKRFSSPTVCNTLAVLAQDADTQSKEYFNKIVEGGDFNMETIKKYKELRGLYHLRCAKRESMLSANQPKMYK